MPELPEVESARPSSSGGGAGPHDRRRRRLRRLRLPPAPARRDPGRPARRRAAGGAPPGQEHVVRHRVGIGPGSASTWACRARSYRRPGRHARSTAATTGRAAGNPGDYRWSRFALTFADGGRLMLVDPRRLGRVRLDPPVEALGPGRARDHAGRVPGGPGRAARPRSRRACSTRRRIAGIGNLLADEILWRARLHPSRPVNSLTAPEITRLLRAMRSSIKAALRGGGVHTLTVIPARKEGGSCPRDHALMERGTVGGRTSWWCSAEQVLTEA